MFVFRTIQEHDNIILAAIIRNVFNEYDIPRTGTVYSDPRTDDLFKLFETPGSHYWVVEEDGRILGGCGIFPTEGLPDGCAELVKFYLSPDARGKGIGKELMEKSLDSARKLGYKMIYLESFPQLEKAVVIYKNAGFRMLDKPLGNSRHSACTMWMIKDL